MSWKKRALAAALAGLCLLSGCSLPGRQQDEGPKDTVDVSDAYFGLQCRRVLAISLPHGTDVLGVYTLFFERDSQPHRNV